jgi:predicted nucleic acid-binding Zn finger protein
MGICNDIWSATGVLHTVTCTSMSQYFNYVFTDKMDMCYRMIGITRIIEAGHFPKILQIFMVDFKDFSGR